MGMLMLDFYRSWKLLVAQSFQFFVTSRDCSPPGSSYPFSARILAWLAIPFSRDFPDPGIEPRSPALQADSLQSEPPGNLIFVEDIQILFSYLSDSQIDTVEKMGPIFSLQG